MTRGELGTMPAGRRAELLTTAAREFASAGYERASLNRVIRSCGLSKSSFYHYVDSKEQLFDLAVEHVAQTLLATVPVPPPEELTGPRCWSVTRDLLQQFARHAAADPATARLGTIFALDDAPVASSATHVGARIEGWLSDLLRRARAAGRVRDDTPLDLQVSTTLAMLRAFDAWTLRQVGQLDAGALATLVDRQADALERLLAP